MFLKAAVVSWKGEIWILLQSLCVCRWKRKHGVDTSRLLLSMKTIATDDRRHTTHIGGGGGGVVIEGAPPTWGGGVVIEGAPPTWGHYTCILERIH